MYLKRQYLHPSLEAELMQPSPTGCSLMLLASTYREDFSFKKGVNNLFFNPSWTSELPETWIMRDELYGAIFIIFICFVIFILQSPSTSVV